MEEVFKDIIYQLAIINNFFKIKTLTKKDLIEQEEHYDDLVHSFTKLNLLLDTMQQRTPTKDIIEGIKNLVRLHRSMSCIYWHVENALEQVIDIVKQYPALSNDSRFIEKCSFLDETTRKTTHNKTDFVEKVFKKVIEQLTVIDKSLKTNVLSKTVLQKEAEHYDDFILMMQELRALLLTMQCTPLTDVKEGGKNLMKLYILINNVHWYVRNVHNRVREVFYECPDLDDMQNYSFTFFDD